MTEPPEISFCLPVFNASERIERCLRAIIAQSVTSREILVVENCSTNDTAAKTQEMISSEQVVAATMEAIRRFGSLLEVQTAEI